MQTAHASLLWRAIALSGLKGGYEAGSLLSTARWFALSTNAGSVGSRPTRFRAAYGTDASSSGAASGQSDEAEDPATIERYRAAKRFRRRADGRIQLYGKEGDSWMEAKLDGYVEGSLLLLGREGSVYYLVSEDLKQIDLSNDQLVGTLFGEGGWEKIMQPLYTQSSGGDLKHVRMTPQQFRSIFTVLKEAPPPPGASEPSG